MRKLLPTFLFSIILFSGYCQKREPAFYMAYPSFEELEKHILGTYHGVSRYENGEHFELIKDLSGVSLQLRDMNNMPTGKRYLLWASSERKYVNPAEFLVLDAASNEDEWRLRSTLERRKVQYSENVFCGYHGWAQDVIDELGAAKKLNPKLQYGLARAYSELAISMVSPRLEAGLPANPFDEKYDKADVPKETLQEFESLMAKSINAFKKLEEMKPDYEILVGYPGFKVGNEYMTAWLDLSQMGFHKKAAKYIKPDIYPQILRSYARWMLGSCPKNSFLFTNGDNDTYPLMYLQESEGYRTDVTVINLSLLNTARYLNYLTELIPEDQKPKFTVPVSRYKDERMAYILINGNEEPLSVPDAMEKVTYLHEEDLFSLGENRIPQLSGIRYAPPAREEKTPMYSSEFKEMTNLDPRGGSEYKGYLYRQDIALLDLIFSNDRPVSFSTGIQSESLLGLEDYLSLEGIVYVLRPYKANPTPSDPYKMGSVRSGRHAEILTKQFDYTGLEGQYDPVSRYHGAASNLRICFLRFMMQDEPVKDAKSGEAVLSMYLALFPPGRLDPDIFEHKAAEYAFELGENNVGASLYEGIISYVRDIEQNRVTTGSFESEREKRYYEFMLLTLPDLLTSRGLEKEAELVRELKRFE